MTSRRKLFPKIKLHLYGHLKLPLIWSQYSRYKRKFLFMHHHQEVTQCGQQSSQIVWRNQQQNTRWRKREESAIHTDSKKILPRGGSCVSVASTQRIQPLTCCKQMDSESVSNRPYCTATVVINLLITMSRKATVSDY